MQLSKHRNTVGLPLLGVQGRSPCKKDDVILRARPQTILRPKDLVTRKLFFARRGACTKKLDVNYRIIIVKRECLHFYKSE